MHPRVPGRAARRAERHALVGPAYQAAVTLWANEASGIWVKFSGLGALQGIFVLASAQLISATKSDVSTQCSLPSSFFADAYWFLIAVVSLTGALSSLGSRRVIARAFSYQDYYIRRACAIEQLHFPAAIHVANFTRDSPKGRSTRVRVVAERTFLLLAILQALLFLYSVGSVAHAHQVTPNPSLERTATGGALGPRSGQCHHPLRGPSAPPAAASQLKR